jgi:hypothetical protein
MKMLQITSEDKFCSICKANYGDNL